MPLMSSVIRTEVCMKKGVRLIVVACIFVSAVGGFSYTKFGQKFGEKHVASKWHRCSSSSNCVFTLTGGGWAHAVNGRYLKDFQSELSRIAPFTEYYMWSDCFKDEVSYQAYIHKARKEIQCVENQCVVRTAPVCAEKKLGV